MTEEEKKKLAEEQGNAPEATEAPASEEPAAPAAEAPTEMPAEPSYGDRNREWMKNYNPDLNQEDQAAYDEALNGVFSDYDKYKENTNNLRKHIGDNTPVGRMLMAAVNDPDFSLPVWVMENLGMDLTAAAEDEQLSDKMAQATAKWNEAETKKAENKKLLEENFPVSMQEIQSYAEEKGQAPEQVQQILERVFDIVDAVHTGNYTDLYKVVSTSDSYDKDMENAREEGKTAGRQTKVEETLRKMPKAQSRQGGAVAQAPAPEKPKKRNMFVD